METSGGKKLDANVGIPIPKLTYIPSSNSFAALFTILSLPADSLDIAPPSPPLASSVMVVRSILFSYDGPLTRRRT